MMMEQINRYLAKHYQTYLTFTQGWLGKHYPSYITQAKEFYHSALLQFLQHINRTDDFQYTEKNIDAYLKISIINQVKEQYRWDTHRHERETEYFNRQDDTTYTEFNQDKAKQLIFQMYDKLVFKKALQHNKEDKRLKRKYRKILQNRLENPLPTNRNISDKERKQRQEETRTIGQLVRKMKEQYQHEGYYKTLEKYEIISEVS